MSAFIYFYTKGDCKIRRYCRTQGVVALDHAGDKESITDYEIWRLWTYQFAHVGISHLSLNVLLQVCFGTVLETIHGVGLDNFILPFLVFHQF